MNYMTYHSIDVVNGPGTRCTLFVSGCIHACRGCYNQKSWNVDAGHEFTQEFEDKIISDLQCTDRPLQGLSLSGGDPLHPSNVDAVFKLVKRVIDECPGKDIYMWSGYLLADMDHKQRSIVDLIDVLIDGKFEQDKYDPALKWRGSSNQVIHMFT